MPFIFAYLIKSFHQTDSFENLYLGLKNFSEGLLKSLLFHRLVYPELINQRHFME